MSKNPNSKKYSFPHLPEYDPWRDANGIYAYYPKDAKSALDFFENELRFTKGSFKGHPFVPADFQKDIIRCLFGFKRISDGVRRYRKFFLYIPRKNGKSEFVAGISNYIMYCDHENDAEIYVGARDRGQALTLYNMIKGMIEQNEELQDDVEFRATYKEILANWDNSKIQAISSDALSAHSLSPHIGIIDEVHAQPNGDLITAITSGMGARDQPLTILITTADLDRPSICNEELDYAKSVRDAKIINPRYLPIIYETPKKSDWQSEEIWKIANPNYPITPTKDFMENAVLEAQGNPRKISDFCRYNLNMQTSNVEGWIDAEQWRACQAEFVERQLFHRKCWGAIDLSSKVDISCFTLLFETGEVLLYAYTCKRMVEKDKTGKYGPWVTAGLLKVAGEDRIDYDYIRADMENVEKKFDIAQWGYDPWNASQFVLQLEKEEEFKEKMVEFRQGMISMNEPSKEFEALLKAGDLKHNNEVLDWMASNVTVYEDANGNIKPMKFQKDSPLKVDGIVTTVMCVGLRMVDKQEEESVYEKRGIRTI